MICHECGDRRPTQDIGDGTRVCPPCCVSLLLDARRFGNDLLEETEHFLQPDLVADFRDEHRWLSR